MNRRRLGEALRISLAVLLVAVLLFPVYWIFLTAILPTSAVLSRTPSLLPRVDQVTLDPFISVMQNTQMLAWFGNSIAVTALSAIASTGSAALAGYALSRFHIRGSSWFAYTLFVGRVLPGTLVVLPFFVMFRSIGYLDTLAAVVVVNTAAIVPFATWLMKSYFDSVPRELDEAALVDGCTRTQALRFVLLPVSAPGLAATVAFAATASWIELLYARTLLLDGTNWTVPVGIMSLIGDVGVNWNEVMAAGAISILPVLVVYWFVQPHLVSGITSGAVKE